MVIERRNFQRVYDLTHRVMPDWNDERDLLTQAEAEHLMLEKVRVVWASFVPNGLRTITVCVDLRYHCCLSAWRKRARLSRWTSKRWARMAAYRPFVAA
jgi:uncharacterized protein YcaQ